MNMNYTLERAETVVSLEEYVRECIDVPKFLECCKQCPSYNTRWSCPPFAFDPMDIWRKYNTLHLHALILRPADCDKKTMMEAFWKEKPGFDRWLLELEREVPGSFVLSGGTCSFCGACQRAQGKPCCSPDLLRYSIEALGGDVGKTMERYFGKPIQWMQDDRAPEYLMLVGGLLIP